MQSPSLFVLNYVMSQTRIWSFSFFRGAHAAVLGFLYRGFFASAGNPLFPLPFSRVFIPPITQNSNSPTPTISRSRSSRISVIRFRPRALRKYRQNFPTLTSVISPYAFENFTARWAVLPTSFSWVSSAQVPLRFVLNRSRSRIVRERMIVGLIISFLRIYYAFSSIGMKTKFLICLVIEGGGSRAVFLIRRQRLRELRGFED